MKHISQIDLVSAIMLHLEKKERVKNLTHKQMNACIAAANIVVEAMAQAYKPAAECGGLDAWLASDETGMSSKYMAHVLVKRILSRSEEAEQNYPRDPSDFGRCVGLLAAVPEIRDSIHVLTNGHGPEWAALASNWDRLEALYRDELPSGEAPRLYAEMQRLFALVRKDAR